MSGIAPCVNPLYNGGFPPKSFMNKENLLFFVHHLAFAIEPLPFSIGLFGSWFRKDLGASDGSGCAQEPEATSAANSKPKFLLRCMSKKKRRRDACRLVFRGFNDLIPFFDPFKKRRRNGLAQRSDRQHQHQISRSELLLSWADS